MKLSSRMPVTGDVLKVPRALASEATIGGGLNPPSLRMAIVLATFAFHGQQGEWSMTKPDLERRVDVVLDNAYRLLEPLRLAVLQKGDQTVPLFETVDYEPGTRWKTAGIIKVRLTFLARELLYSRQKTVMLPLDEFRMYSTISGIMLRMRLAARMQAAKTAMIDQWRFRAEDFSDTGAFGSYANMAAIKRTNAGGETVEYLSLSRAAQVLLEKGVAEINVRAKGVSVELIPLKNGANERSRWIAVDIETKRLHKPKSAKKPSIADLNKKSKQPALAAR